jgi:hypothetical protein
MMHTANNSMDELIEVFSECLIKDFDVLVHLMYIMTDLWGILEDKVYVL